MLVQRRTAGREKYRFQLLSARLLIGMHNDLFNVLDAILCILVFFQLERL